jgi:coenzyme F420-reducing hydrogenase delta subunit
MTSEPKHGGKSRVLVLATSACAYPGADNVGQVHREYPTNVYVVRVPAPVVFPERFYLDCFEKGLAGIIVMSCGHECPYEGAYDRLAARVAEVHRQMKAQGRDPRRLRLCAVCTVCTEAFLREVQQMSRLVAEGVPGG